jgi:hypothetical protein
MHEKEGVHKKHTMVSLVADSYELDGAAKEKENCGQLFKAAVRKTAA